MESEAIDPEEARAWFRRRITNVGIGSLERLPLSVARILKDAGIPLHVSEGANVEDVPSLLSHKAHHRLLTQLPGPGLGVRDDETKSSGPVEKANLLLEDSVQVREAVAFELLQSSSAMAPQTRALLQHISTHREDNARSLVAADAISSDFLLQLAGFRQCMAIARAGVPVEGAFNETITAYLHRLLFPSPEALEGLGLAKDAPMSQAAAAVAHGRQADSIVAGLDLFFDGVGHLPLVEAYSAASIVDQFAATAQDPDSLLDSIIAWQGAHPSPFAGYQALAALVFSRVPLSGHEDQVWNLFEGLVHRSIPDAESEADLAIRTELARHFARHLECSFVFADGERTSASAWWLAERVASVLADSVVPYEKLREGLLGHAFEVTAALWAATRQPTVPHRLRYATFFDNHLWSRACFHLLGALSARLQGKREAIDVWVAGVREARKESDPRIKCDEVLYAFDRDELEGHATSLVQEVANAEDAIGLIAEFGGGAAELSASAVKAALVIAMSDTALGKRLWDVFRTPEWRQQLVASSGSEIPDGLLLAMGELALRDERGGAVAEDLAAAAGNDGLSVDAHRALAVAALGCATLTGTPQVVAQLRHSSRSMVDPMNYWRSVLERSWQLASPLSRARMRPMLAWL